MIAIIVTVILSIVAIIHFIVLLATYKSQAKYNKGMLFAVTLPAHAMEDPTIRNIQARFNKQLMQAGLWMAVLLIPIVLLHYWHGYQVIYFFVWFFTYTIISVVPFRRAFRDTLALKRENDWFVGAKRVIQSDLRAAYLKNQRSAPIWLFAIPLAMSIGLLLWSAGEQQLLVVTFGGFFVTVMCLLISLFMRRTKAKVYSTNSELNVSLNQARRRSISYMWLYTAILGNIHFFLISLFIINENDQMVGIWLTMTLLFSAIPVAVVLYVYRKITLLEQETLAQDGKIVYTDDDEYWSNGFTYHNPQDSAIFVPKRIGIGETVNTATLAGKIIVWGSVSIIIAAIFGVSFLLIRSEVTQPVLTVTPEHKIEIDYPMYSFAFNVADIEQIALVGNVPSGIKTNGEGTDQYARGHFRLKELGKSRLYIYKTPPYIQIKLQDMYVFYNEKDPQQTKQLFERLQSQINK